MNEFGPIILLEPVHVRDHFDCGNDALNTYLKRFALQNQKKGVIRNYVTCRGLRIVGFYSLAYGSVEQDDAPSALAKGIGRYPIPVMILARMAVDSREQGKGLGSALLKNAIMRTLRAAEIGGLKAIFVQAKDSIVQKFYAKHGFIPSPVDPLRLFFSLDQLRT